MILVIILPWWDSLIKTGYTFSGWTYSGVSYASGDSVNNLTGENWANVEFIAEWNKNSYTITYKANSWTGDDVVENVNYDETYTFTGWDIFSKTGYTFTWWNTNSWATNPEYIGWQSITWLIDSGLDLYAIWQANTYTLTFDANSWTVSPTSWTVTYGDNYWILPTPTRDWFDFNGWFTEVSTWSQISSWDTVSITWDVTLYAHWTQKQSSGWSSSWGGSSSWGWSSSWGGWGWWWGWSSRSSATSTTWSNATWSTQNLEEVSLGGEVEVNTGDNTKKSTQSYTTPTSTDIEKYGEEFADTYVWARENNIIKANDIKDAKMYTPITRAELAKMMVVYMSWVLHKQPVLSWTVTYEDVNQERVWDLEEYIYLAYQYQIMGIHADGTPIKKFKPYELVTRAEFATVLSRVLFGNIYNQSWTEYYEQHLKALFDLKILTKPNPTIKELRWQIMLMLYRARNVEIK